jgi:nitroreductase
MGAMTILRNGHPFDPLQFTERTPAEMLARARGFRDEMERRRSVRDFSGRPVARELIELAIETASTAPSGAHRQPWTFVAVADPELKATIRSAAEAEEQQSYEGGRMPDSWLAALAPLGTDWRKPYLQTVPWIVILFEQTLPAATTEGRRNYYVRESVGICAGLFITAIHNMGLATLPHTPSPMKFLTKILGRPPTERPFAMFPIGYPADDCHVPQLRRKTLAEVAVFATSSTREP